MRLALLLVLCSAAAAQEYERMLDDARRVLDDEAMPLAGRFDLQHERLAQAALAYPRRWEAYFERGENRCNRAYHFRADADIRLADARATGMDDATMAEARKEIDTQIARWRQEAYREFSVAENILRREGLWRPDHEVLIFSNAALKFAGREYMKTPDGKRGAIEDFKELAQRNFAPERCMNHIALCYLDAGHEAYLKDNADEALRLWDEGLKWARNRFWVRLFWTNKAAVYGLEHQYQLAEDALRRLIAADPGEPAHEKNLGLTLGFQNRLKEALLHYDRARELCRTSEGDGRARANGNAWLRPAVIHGTLLEHEGDVRLAWRLFLEYRRLFGDDYNFSLWFGDFAGAHGAYDVAWRFLERARDLRPNCLPAYQKLAQIAPRTKGTREELEVRTRAAAQALGDAQARAAATHENPVIAKICGGVADLGDIGLAPDAAQRLAPDPLDGLDQDRPPAWVEAAAGARDPFVPFVPAVAPEAPSDTPAVARPKVVWPYVAVIAALGAAALLFLFRKPSA